LSGLPLETVLIEALLPHNVAAIIDCQTDNKNRTLQDIRGIISRAGGTLTPVSFMFERKGKIWFREQDKVGVDEALDEAIEAGATDIISEEGKLVVETPPSEVTSVADRLSKSLELEVERLEIVYDPNEETMVKLTDGQGEELQPILDAIEDDPSLQNLYINASPE
jgi:transcriptional/translational regulatory protein YebC/TACO1